MIIIAVLLFMLRVTGMTAHIALSAAGLVILVVYALATKKDWKCPVLEILYRICYAIALITGIILINIHGIPALSLIHKISAVSFGVLLVMSEIQKAVKK